MIFPTSIRIPAAFLERLSLDAPHPGYLTPGDIIVVLARPDEFTRDDVDFCRQAAWDALIFAAIQESISGHLDARFGNLR